MFSRYIFSILFLLAISFGWAQSPVPGPAQPQPIAILGATAHLGNGDVIENALITFAEGKITGVGSANEQRELEGYRRIDASGKQVYPGLIAPNTSLGLVEINAVRSTRDFSEAGTLNPNARAIIAYNTDSQVTPTVRSRGVLYAQTTPSGGLISGSSSIVQLDAWNWEDATVRMDEGMHVNLPRRRSYNWREGRWTNNKNYAKELESLRSFIEQAQAYCTAPEPEANLRLSAMCGLFEGTQQFYIHANAAPDILQAIALAKSFDLPLVIVGGAQSYLLTDLLLEQDVAVILGPTHELPSTLDEDIDQAFRTPAILHEAGVRFCLSNGGHWQQRNLPFLSGSAIAYGLPYEAAVKAVTLDAAKILGFAEQAGSLEVGKAATLIISSGDIFDMRSSQVEQAFIDGRQVDLDNKQAQLYRKFKTKYERGK
jgi:imidazolonepropionase-like amidohydrolase